MAEFSMWGPAESGPRLVEQDAQQKQLNNIAMQDHASNIRARDQQTAIQGQQAQQAQQQNAIKLAQQQSVKDTAIANATKPFQEQALAQIAAGNVDEGDRMLRIAGQLDDHTAKAEQARATAEEKSHKQAVDFLTHVGNTINSVQPGDDAGLQQALEIVSKADSSPVPDWMKTLKATPQNLQMLKDYQTTQKTRVEEQIKKQAEARKERDEQRKEARDSVLKLRDEAAAEAAKARADKLKKNGGETAKTAKEDRAEAFAIMKQRFPDMGTDAKGAPKDAAALNAANYISDQARRLVTVNRGLDMPTALNQALNSAIADGTIEKDTLTKKHRFWPDEKTEQPKFSPKGGVGKAPEAKGVVNPTLLMEYAKKHDMTQEAAKIFLKEKGYAFQ